MILEVTDLVVLVPVVFVGTLLEGLIDLAVLADLVSADFDEVVAVLDLWVVD